MLAPKLHSQRLIVEFYTNKNLYDSSIVEPLMENFLYDLTATLGMTMIIDPIVKTVNDGTSAYVMFIESGCQVHSWFEYKFVSVDLYSCKPYMVSDVLNVIEYWFDPQEIEII
jgi:S-adenosylmethionine/arginine decarboxylase-like enzyme